MKLILEFLGNEQFTIKSDDDDVNYYMVGVNEPKTLWSVWYNDRFVVEHEYNGNFPEIVGKMVAWVTDMCKDQIK